MKDIHHRYGPYKAGDALMRIVDELDDKYIKAKVGSFFNDICLVVKQLEYIPDPAIALRLLNMVAYETRMKLEKISEKAEPSLKPVWTHLANTINSMCSDFRRDLQNYRKTSRKYERLGIKPIPGEFARINKG